ncbi:MAG: sulfurtransferase FdhD, partial [Planctomycetaceae bacterium]|nr:sulfurtransferase FdhD [Planctomycetaceae bacterium]MCP4082870.1 sulfurtransferase FdhD [Planctomycetaceae bacterium]
MKEFTLAPDPEQEGLSVGVSGIDQDGNNTTISVVNEQPLTL